MNLNSPRVRFAPSPTGIMHLGNIRAALLNYLFATRYHGTYVLRIEDTDHARNIDHGTETIIANLSWLGISYNEGPVCGGPHQPYKQSERATIYDTYLARLQSQDLVYKCFCTPEELETITKQQAALKQPPRYARTCRKLDQGTIDQHLANKRPFVWRFKLPESGKLTVHDMSKGTINFEAEHFSDFPIARQDGSYMFIFSNCVDDIEMKISHIIRGQDHLSNSALQIALFNAYKAPSPTFWHLPIICNTSGQKLSKRDRGFSLIDLQELGFLPQAICNYLGIIGRSVDKEILSLDELSATYPFDNVPHNDTITYDESKLSWINQQWIARLQPAELLPHLLKHAPKELAESQSQDTILRAFNLIKPEIRMLSEWYDAAKFCFVRPQNTDALVATTIVNTELCENLKKELITLATQTTSPQDFITQCKTLPQRITGLSMKTLWMALRASLAGKTEGPSVAEICTILGMSETMHRIKLALR